jgi:hypothetical protein
MNVKDRIINFKKISIEEWLKQGGLGLHKGKINLLGLNND